MNCPTSNVKYQINGNVHGFPKSVPIIAAAIEPPIIHEINIAIKACNPINGVKDIATPVAKPKDNSCGEPFILFKLRLMYFLVLEKIKRDLKKNNKFKKTLFFLFLPKGISTI